MSAEYAAEVLAALVARHADVMDEPCEDVRTGGWFFDMNLEGRDYEVLVIETNGGAR